MRTVIIEDEEGPKTVLKNQLKRYCPSIELLGEADSVNTGISLIRNHQPELIFLDIYLREGTGFDVLDQLSSKAQVIFTTAYDDFALRAFQYNAVHYLLKPLIPVELVSAINRLKRYPARTDQLETAIHTIRTAKKPQKIAVHSISKITYIEVARIVRCESEESYTHVFMEDGSSLLSTKPLKDFETLLGTSDFFRIHRSHLINLHRVNEYHKNKADSVLMQDGSHIQVSRKKRTEFLDSMNGLLALM